MKHWLSTSLKELVYENLLNRKELVGLEINQAELTAMYKRHEHGYNDYTQALWMLLSLALWEKKYILS